AAVINDAPRGLDTLAQLRDERHPHIPVSRIHAVHLAGKVLAWQHGHVRGGEQLPRERSVVASGASRASGTSGHARPQVETGVRVWCGQYFLQHRDDRPEFVPIADAVVTYVCFVAPGRDAGVLHGEAHRASMIRAIEE